MRINIAAFIVYLTLTLFCLVLIFLNWNFFKTMVDGIPKMEDYPLLISFWGRDSVAYYKLDFSVIAKIYEGFLNGGVEIGSIFSLVGVAFVNGLFKSIDIPVQLGWLFFNLSIFFFCSYWVLRNNIYCFFSIILQPILLSFLLVPNKEIITTCFLLLLFRFVFRNEKIKFNPSLVLFGFFRETYVLWLVFIKAIYFSKLNFFITVYIFFAILSLIIPDSIYNYSGSRDYSLKDFVLFFNEFLQTGFFAPVAILIKSIFLAVLYYVRGFFVQNDLLAFMQSISGVFSLFFIFSTSFSKRNFSNYFKVFLIGFFIFSLAPGMSVRHISPFMLLLPCVFLLTSCKTTIK